MSGIIRNLLTLIQAFCTPGRADPWTTVRCHFWITPFDCGTSVLKSDIYLQLAEAAQLDFLVKTGLLGTLLRARCRFVNASQHVRFLKPVGMMKRISMDTAILYADDKCIYFAHTLLIADRPHGEILVKAKFKKGALTVLPADILGTCHSRKPRHIAAWDQMLEQMQQG